MIADDAANAAAAGALPPGFEALLPYLDRALPSDAARYAKRVTSDYADLNAFYQTMLPLHEAAIDLVDRFELGAMPADVERLYLLLLSLNEAGLAIEVFGAADVPNAVPAGRIRIHAPGFLDE